MTTALTRLKPVWNERSISLNSKIQLMCSLVTWMFLYAFKSWTVTAEPQRRMRVMEMRCYRKIQCFLYKDHATNEEVLAKIQKAIGPQKNLLDIVKRHKLKWYWLSFISSGQNHLARHSERGKKTRQTEKEMGRQHQGMDLPGVHEVREGSREQGKMEETGCEVICGAPVTSTVKG